MSAAILDQGKTAIRDALKTLVTHLSFASDSTAFSGAQVVVNPSGAGTVLTKAATKTDVDGSTVDFTAQINGTTEFTNGQIATLALAKGTAVTGAGRDTLTRTVRSQTIGVQAGDLYTLGVRATVQDNS
jgi:hypothetical protein